MNRGVRWTLDILFIDKSYECHEKLSSFAKNMRERIYVNSALIQRFHSSHLQFSTPLPPPTVHLLRRLDALGLDAINNFKILKIRNFNFFV